MKTTTTSLKSVFVYYPFKFFGVDNGFGSLDDRLENFAKIFGGRWTGAGAGAVGGGNFKSRDVSFKFKTEELANKFISKAKRRFQSFRVTFQKYT